jgi:hypothetical protein
MLSAIKAVLLLFAFEMVEKSDTFYGREHRYSVTYEYIATFSKLGFKQQICALVALN